MIILSGFIPMVWAALFLKLELVGYQFTKEHFFIKISLRIIFVSFYTMNLFKI